MKKDGITSFGHLTVLILLMVGLASCYPEDEPWLDEVEFGGAQRETGSIDGVDVINIEINVRARPEQAPKLMWSITLHNSGPALHNIKAIVEFRNADGEFIEDDIVTGIHIPEGRSIKVSSYIAVSEEIAAQIDDATVHLVEER